MVAEFLHKRVWFWDATEDHLPRRMHLIIRRTPKTDGSGWLYKYSMSNAPAKTTTQRLAYQQSQRFWVEQAIKDGKDGLGMDEYQARKWNAWQHHMALTMIAGLFVLKTRMEKRIDMPLLSITDVREILGFLLPKKVQTLEDLMTRIKNRHQRRKKTYEWAKARGPCLALTFDLPADPQVTK